MLEEREKKLSKIACKLSSMTFVLHGCCENYEGTKIDTAKLIDLIQELHDTSNELFINMRDYSKKLITSP